MVHDAPPPHDAPPSPPPYDAPPPYRPSPDTATNPSARIRGARRVAIITIVASLGITAALGILALLGGEMGDTQWRILSTTLLVAGFGITALCHLAVAGRPIRIVGFAGLAVSGVALALGVVLVWANWGWQETQVAWRWFAVFGIAAVSLAHANLLLLLSTRRRAAVRAPLAVTLVAIAVVATMLALPPATDFSIPTLEAGETYWRWFGVAAIIDALGTIVVPILALFLREEAPAAAAAPPTVPVVPRPEASELEARIAALVAETGLERDALVSAALDAFDARRAGLG